MQNVKRIMQKIDAYATENGRIWTFNEYYISFELQRNLWRLLCPSVHYNGWLTERLSLSESTYSSSLVV